jgi:diguanylate cyclase (GGDEF)-like protein
MLCLVILIMLQTAMALKMARKNQLLEQKAYIDIHTGLPNKGSCEELLNNREILREPTACVIFDLNNLKTVNDTRGHSAGDQLILSFARLLRRVIPEKHFVGRYGGDEFMAVIYHTDRQEVEGILDSLRREADAANRDGNQLPLSYAYGWAISADYEGCIMQTLLDKADYCMYENKRAYYATHDRRAPRP